MPGLAALNQGNDAELSSVSCAAPGDCSAGGFYIDGSAAFQGFVITEKNGTRGAAREVPGLGALNLGGFARVTVVSCASAGNCAAGGLYHTGPVQVQAFVVTEANGRWGTARQVPGTLALNTGQDAFVTSLSCALAGNCAGAGQYDDSTSRTQAFVIAQVGGTWGAAIKVPGLLALDKGDSAATAFVSCRAPAGCTAGGFYHDGSGRAEPFVIARQ